jgi:Tol biopolymer transport system component
MKNRKPAFLIVALAAGVLFPPQPANAQYFGRNKIQYENFNFRIFETPNYRLYFYPVEQEAARDMARMAERWQTRLSSVFSRQLSKRKPILIYADQPDFQQTNAVGEQLTEGTGGVTESLRDRLIMPLTGVYRDNDHVLGHEMVHVFQYDLAQDPKLKGQGGGVENLPLWVVEGIAEYLSLGRDDPHTAMWMRDAVLRNKLPTIKQLTTDTRFFPYRYGEALWAYVGGRSGDRTVAETYKASLRFGFENGIRRAVGISSDSLSKEWIAATKAAYAPVIAGRTIPSQSGTPLIPAKRDGDTNLSPVISPDGRYVAFFAARDLFGFDLYLADAATGKSIKKLADIATSTEFDALSFIASAGTWSPDGKKFAFIVYAKGDQEIAILDVASRNVERRIHIPDVGSIQNPAWSPDGSRIAFSGMVGGLSDLFVYDLNTRKATRLTNDKYGDIQPSWSPDGNTLVFSTDRGDGTDFTRLSSGHMQLALIDVNSHSIRLLNGFNQGKHINPEYSADGNDIYFVSDRSGVSDIYRINLQSGALFQVTNVATGISGITSLAPAISVSHTDGRLAFSIFDRQGYGIYGLSGDQVRGLPVQPADYASAGFLPPAPTAGSSAVASYLADPLTGLPPADSAFTISPFRSSFALAAIGQPTVGVGTSTTGTFVGGGTSFFFTDILGNKNLGFAVNANGTVKDFGGEVMYQNIGHRFVWALDASHTPYATAFAGVTQDQRNPSVLIYSQITQRVYFDQASVITQYPLSVTKRFELTAGVNRLGFNNQVFQQAVQNGSVIGEQTFDSTGGPSIHYGQVAAAFVGDNSFNGFTGPIRGYRYRFQASPAFGDFQFTSALLDVRKYFFARPLTFAVRGIHVGRYGGNAESSGLYPLFVGDPSVVRGYSAQSFDVSECSNGANGSCPEFDRMIGSRIAAFNAELRIPLLGTEQFGLIKTPLFPVDIAPFFDAGVAWSRNDAATFKFARTSTERVPVFSTGISARANFFGYAIVELYYAHPFQRPNKNWVFGFQLAPGW